MAITAAQVIARAQPLLFDAAGVRWPESELLNWVADGQILVSEVIPSSTGATATIDLAAGTKQTLPTAYSRLLKLVRNMGTDGTEPGSIITVTTRQSLDAVRPNWHTDEGEEEIQHYVYEPEEDRRTFYVYPGLPDATKVEGVFSRRAPSTVNSGADLLLSESYLNPLVDWVMFRALSKQADYGSAGPRAQSHAQAFAAAVGMDMRTISMSSPNRSIRGQANGQNQ